MIGRSECSPRKIKRIKTQAEADPNDELTYQFYKRIIHLSIFKLHDEKGNVRGKPENANKINFTDVYFRKAPPCNVVEPIGGWKIRRQAVLNPNSVYFVEELSVVLRVRRAAAGRLERNERHTIRQPGKTRVFFFPAGHEQTIIMCFAQMEMIKNLQATTKDLTSKKEVEEQTNAERWAAVSKDLCSYTVAKTSQNLAQSFYARSDFKINTWHNPSSILLPNTFDQNDWEIYLHRLYILNQ